MTCAIGSGGITGRGRGQRRERRRGVGKRARRGGARRGSTSDTGYLRLPALLARNPGHRGLSAYLCARRPPLLLGRKLTLNIITLAGLTIAVGRVVDDAIVVLENSYRYVQNGYEPEESAFKGTTEVASAITSSTLTTIAVFLPLALVGGIVSKFFVPLSLTVALALVASLIVAVTIIPVLVSIFLRRHTGNPARQLTNLSQNED